MGIIHYFSVSRSRKILGITLACILLLGCTVLLIYTVDPYHCRMADGVRIGSLDVSGMTRRQARQALESALEASLYTESLAVQLPEETLHYDPELLNPQVNIRAAVRAAYAYGRKDNHSQQVDLLSYLEVPEDALKAPLQEYAQKYNTVLTQPVWSLEGTQPSLSTADYSPDAPGQTLQVTLGYPQLDLDVEAVYTQILRSYADAPALCSSNQYHIQPEVIPSQLPEVPDMQEMWRAVCFAPENDSLDMETYQLVHGSYGYEFDPIQLQKQISHAGYGETVSVPLTGVTPEIMGDQVYFRDLLGYCDTKHTSNENRNTNLRLLCAAMDGYILQPGEVFSFNEVVGERTREKGYMPAPAFSGNRLIDSVGGGVCQGSTTLYNCVLLADLDVIFRACHGATISYVPLGLDATVNWGTTDFQFGNNFHFPIMIRAEVSDGYVKMQIWGTDEKDYYVKMETRTGEDEVAFYSRSYKCKYSKATDELISRETEAFSTYYKDIG